MAPQEKSLFEEEMRSNKDLATIVELYQRIDEGIETSGTGSEDEILLRSSLKNIHVRYLKEERVKVKDNGESLGLSLAEKKVWAKIKKIKLWRVAAAAVVIGVIVLGALWVFQKKDKQTGLVNKENDVSKTNPDSNNTTKTIISEQDRLIAIYARNFSPDAVPAKKHEFLKRGLEQYGKRAYNEAIASIDINKIRSSVEDLRPRGEQTAREEAEEKEILFYANYYKALSYMAVNASAQAVPLLRTALQQSPNLLNKTKAQWYLALALINLNNKDEAMKLLNQIVGLSDSNPYKQKAVAVIAELDKE
jgi:tetratricopeptide (TPR) repeat protein